MKIEYADVMELVDVPDSKSGVGNYVPVRPRPSAFFKKTPQWESFLFFIFLPKPHIFYVYIQKTHFLFHLNPYILFLAY